ncbi:Unknown protein [Striga hermonthica]|uniref:Myb/SANT-like domain-containing protein n=1 Tax=Striga hermonthica TaxID=68872 RepID=A0A9N7RDS3_STRHE|nr:Unknown protein [Striga hermonthica]
MSTSAEDGLTQPKEGEAKLPPNNEARLISLMLDILGKCINQKFKTSNWMDIQKALNKVCGPQHHYEITQITSKHDRLKVKWHRFHNILHNTTGFSWNSETGKHTGGDEVWSHWFAVRPKDKEMKRMACVHYRELTTIFIENTQALRGAEPVCPSQRPTTQPQRVGGLASL